VTGEIREVEPGREYRLTARTIAAPKPDAAPTIRARAAGGDDGVAVPVIRLGG
jgi:hypothetical protein